jgi:beta-N-acetylhexosaminidase
MMSATDGANSHPIESPLVLSYDGTEPDPELLGWLDDGIVAGVVIFQKNVRSDDHLRTVITTLRQSSPSPLRIMIDEEGGRVRRLPDGPASMESLRSYRTGSLQILSEAYGRVAGRLVNLGIDTLLAPVVDVGAAASEWLHDRTFSDDPTQVETMARAVVPAIQNRQVSACAKHFPGTRAVKADPHHGVAIDPTPLSEWDRIDALPFRAAIAAGVQLIMVGHQRMMGFDATRPACMSPLIATVLLRERLGFHGLILTDDLAMGAVAKQYPIEDAVRASILAGCNLVLVCQDRLLQRRAVAFWREWVTAGEETRDQ